MFNCDNSRSYCLKREGRWGFISVRGVTDGYVWRWIRIFEMFFFFFKEKKVVSCLWWIVFYLFIYLFIYFILLGVENEGFFYFFIFLSFFLHSILGFYFIRRPFFVWLYVCYVWTGAEGSTLMASDCGVLVRYRWCFSKTGGSELSNLLLLSWVLLPIQ